MDTMHTIPTTRRVQMTRGGQRITFNIDPLTHNRLIHGTHLARLFGTETNLSGVVRAAVAHYMDHLDQVLRVLAFEPEDSSKGERLLRAEQFRLLSANKGGRAPWREFPAEAVWQDGLFEFGQLVRAQHLKLRIDPPEASGVRDEVRQ